MAILKFIPFPRFIDPDIRKYMHPHYSKTIDGKILPMIDEVFYPSVINPQLVGDQIQQNRIVMACQSYTGKTIWVIAPKKSLSHIRLREFWMEFDGKYKKLLVPCCYNYVQEWEARIPWTQLAEMKVRLTENYLIFVPSDFKGEEIETDQCTFYPELQAYVLNK